MGQYHFWNWRLGALTERAAGKTDQRRTFGLPGWRAEDYSTLWLLGSLGCAIFVVLPALPSISSTLLLSWSLVVLLNVFAVHFVVLRAATLPVRELSGSICNAVAAVFGLVWGIGPALIAADLPAAAAIAVILAACVAIALSIPLIASSRNAPFLLLAGFFAPTLWLLLAHGWPLTAVWAGAVLPLLALGAHRHQRSQQQARHLLSELGALHAHAAAQGMALAVDEEDGAEAIPSRLAALHHAIDETRHAMATLGAIPEGLMRVDADGRITFMNAVAEILTGVKLGAALGRPVQDVLILDAPGAEHLTADVVEQAFATGMLQKSSDQTTLRRRDGIVYGVDYVISAVRDAQNSLAGLVFLVRDVTAKREQARAVEWRAAHDNLTALINRAEFESRVGRLFTLPPDPSGNRHALCLIDVDHFTVVNDVHGTGAGDRVLQNIAAALRGRIRGADLLARTGEDEFALLLYSCPIEKARLIADGLRMMIEELSVAWRDSELRVRASVGVVEIDRECPSLAAVMCLAEAACAEAKRQGGNRSRIVRVDDADLRGRDRLLSGLKEIETALRQNRFHLYCQRVVPIDDGRAQPRYGELMLRLPGPDSELQTPREFLSTAERFHLMPDIDRWVVKSAIDCIRLDHPILASLDIVAINISSQSIADDQFIEYVTELLKEEAVPAERLCFEISETHLIKHGDRIGHFVATVKALGCRVALGDFGIGTNSFQLLKRLQVDFLKIDSEFIRNLGSNSVDYEIVLGISRVAKTLRVKTIAEGVSTVATRDVLRGMGIDLIQGFLVEQPQALLPAVVTRSDGATAVRAAANVELLREA